MAVIRRKPQFIKGQKALCVSSGRIVTFADVRGREVRITYDDMQCKIPSGFISDDGYELLKDTAMPEQLKPCPACGGDASIITIEDDKNPCIYFSGWCLCGMHGPEETSESAAIAAWNRLPRALMWGEEPPTVPGWYWFSVCKGHAVCILVDSRGKAKLAKDHFTDADLLGGQWAGPIDAPGESS